MISIKPATVTPTTRPTMLSSAVWREGGGREGGREGGGGREGEKEGREGGGRERKRGGRERRRGESSLACQTLFYLCVVTGAHIVYSR